MTATPEATSGTALAQVASGALALATGDKPFTVGKLVDLLGRQPAAPVPAEKEPFPAPAPVVNLTAELTVALRMLPGLFGAVQVTERRILSAEEIKALTDETITINAVSSQLGARKDAIALTIRHHADCRAEADGRAFAGPQFRGGRLLHAATPRIGTGKAEGHYALATAGHPVEVEVPGYQDSWQIRHTSGESKPSGATLQRLFDEKKITRAEYLSFTREVRVLDEARIAAAIKANPERALEILAAITVTEQAGASTVSPKK